LFLYRVISTKDIKFNKTRKYLDKDEPIEALEAKEIIRVIEILSLDLRSEKDSVLEDYKLSIDAPVNTIIVQDEIALSTITYNITLRYRSIRPIDILIIQLLSPEIILEPEQETTNDIPVFDLIIPIYKSINNNKRAKEHPITLIARGTTKPPAKNKTPKLFKELETDLNPESTNPSSNKQQKRSRYQVYVIILNDLIENPISLGLYLATFGTAIQRQLRLYRSNMLIAPDG
jgi:hypothetical protein